MKRAICCVATSKHYQKGMERLAQAVLPAMFEHSDYWMAWNAEPEHSPQHSEVPYAFKAYALKEAAIDADLLLWCDSSILPIRSLEPLWERIEREGYWISRNGWSNYEWTADSAYPDLFWSRTGNKVWEGIASGMDWIGYGAGSPPWELTREVNKQIPHVVATTFGLNVKHPKGRAFLDEYHRLASQTKAFCGPWINSNSQWANEVQQHRHTTYNSPCGPNDVRGHRHDQTAASVIAWRLGMELTDPPAWFAYSKRRQDGTLHLSDQDERTILLADGNLHDGVVHA